MGRAYLSRFECGHAGCREFATYESATRADQTELYRKYGNGRWLCVRHSQPDEVLSPTNMRRVYEIASEEKFYGDKSIGLYFGHFGFTSGPGFKVFARDFPAGTKLRVTAEIIPPECDAADRPKRSAGSAPLPPAEPLPSPSTEPEAKG